MKSFFGLLLFFLFFISFALAQEEIKIPSKDDDVHTLINALSSENNTVVEVASQLLGERKAIEGLEPLLELAKNHADSRTRLIVITALSNYESLGEPTTTLGNIVLNDGHDEVVYAALLAIANIKDVDNPVLKDVIDFLKEDRIDDVFIKDISARINAYIER